MTPKRILFLATGLHAGGAEFVLLRLLSRLDRERFAPSVISLIESGSKNRLVNCRGNGTDSTPKRVSWMMRKSWPRRPVSC